MPPKILTFFFNTDVGFINQMNNPILAYFFLFRTKVGLPIKHTNVSHSPKIPKPFRWAFHEPQVGGTFGHWFFSAGNNRSQLHRFHAPLRRLKVPFVFKVQSTTNKNQAVLEPGLAFKEHLSLKAFKETQKWKTVSGKLKPKMKWG